MCYKYTAEYNVQVPVAGNVYVYEYISTTEPFLLLYLPVYIFSFTIMLPLPYN